MPTSNGLFDYRLKIAFIGNVGAGKTSVMTRYSRGKFYQRHSSTVGIDSATKILVIDDCRIQLEIWDTAGQERFRTITQSYYRNANGLLVTYDITNYESLEGLNEWIEDVKRYAAPNVLMLLVGTKKDLETEKREVTLEKARLFASRYPEVVDVIETSAKHSINIDKVFEKLARALKNQREASGAVNSPSTPNSLDTDTLAKSDVSRLCSFGPCCSL